MRPLAEKGGSDRGEDFEAAALFDVPTATWSRMKAGSYKGRLDQAKVTRSWPKATCATERGAVRSTFARRG